MFRYGKGGAFNWGTLCGALNGSLYVMTLAAGTKVDPLGSELIGWYTTNPFPSQLCDAYAKFTNVRQTVANSPLCHLSVTLWCNESHFTVNSDQKKDRCAKVAADTAAKAIILAFISHLKIKLKAASKHLSALFYSGSNGSILFVAL